MKSPLCFVVLFALSTAGCRNGGGSAGASASQPPSAATAMQSNDALSRLPAPVATAFLKNHPRASATLIHVRLFPDGTTHYQIIYVDSNGQSQQASYYADGRGVR